MPGSGSGGDQTTVTIKRVPYADTYARVSTVGTQGRRHFVLVPGIGVSSNYFERLAAELNDFGPVHALDLPGFGGVPHPKDAPMTIERYADLVKQVIEELELDDPVVIGHSMGTQVVGDLAARWPDDGPPLHSIVLLGPVVNASERRLSTTLRRFVATARHEPPRVALLALGAYLMCGLPWFFKVLPQMMRYRLEDTLPQIQANVLVVAGEFDQLCPGTWADKVTELLPYARSTSIAGAAHSVMHANAFEVAALCVAHARNPGTEPLPHTPRKAGADEGQQGAAAEGEEAESAASEAAKVATGQLRELVGIVTDDDELLAEGRTAQAEAMEDEQARHEATGADAS